MGPELSGADFLLILLLWAGLCVVVTAPGWVAVALAARRRRTARGPGRSWPATTAGALVGLFLSAVVVPAVAERLPSGDAASAAGVLAGWVACWLLALAVPTGRRAGTHDRVHATAGREH
jgi:protein-S-isoprenylcysteine O-methyltransferase Ste14